MKKIFFIFLILFVSLRIIAFDINGIEFNWDMTKKETKKQAKKLNLSYAGADKNLIFYCKTIKSFSMNILLNFHFKKNKLISVEKIWLFYDLAGKRDFELNKNIFELYFCKYSSNYGDTHCYERWFNKTYKSMLHKAFLKGHADYFSFWEVPDSYITIRLEAYELGFLKTVVNIFPKDSENVIHCENKDFHIPKQIQEFFKTSIVKSDFTNNNNISTGFIAVSGKPKYKDWVILIDGKSTGRFIKEGVIVEVSIGKHSIQIESLLDPPKVRYVDVKKDELIEVYIK